MKGLSMKSTLSFIAISYRWIMPILALSGFQLMLHGQQNHNSILFPNVRIFDGHSAQLTEPSNLLVEGNTIAKIFTAPIALSSVTSTTIINGSGRALTPGLIDAHWHFLPDQDFISTSASHLGRDGDFGYLNIIAGVEAKKTLLRGFTTVRDMAGPTFGLKVAIDEGSIVGPRIYPSGAIIVQTAGHGDSRKLTDLHPRFGGNTPHGDVVGTSVVADGRSEVLAAVREQLREGATQIKLAAGGGIAAESDPLESLQFTPDELHAAVEAASDWGTYVTVHNYSSEGARRAISAGVKCIEHGQLIDEPTMKLVAEKGIWLSIQPFLPATDKSKIPTAFVNSDRRHAKAILVTEATDSAYTLARKYHVKLAFGTDLVGKADVAAHENERLVALARWFTPAELLRMVTASNGGLMALSGSRNPYPKKLGVIEPGAYVDLLLVNGTPLQNINRLRSPDQSLVVIIKNGEVIKNTLEK
jgi:imidazolonepropionase-like amidohydrolase